jgi:hypothetical protein
MGLRGFAFRHLEQRLKARGYVLFSRKKHYCRDGLYTMHNDHFRREPEFEAAYARGVEASDGADPQFEWRLHTALWAARAALQAPGDFVECGVNAGFVSSAIMRALDWNRVGRKFYLIDTFAGPVLEQLSSEEVSNGRRDLMRAALQSGGYVTDMDRIRRNFSEWPNALVTPGRVPDVLPSLGIERVAFLHLDMNCAYPEQAALEFFWDRLARGGAILFDDYTYTGYEAQTKAIDAVARKAGANLLSLPTGQGLIIK